jgi:hypothetical protein
MRAALYSVGKPGSRDSRPVQPCSRVAQAFCNSMTSIAWMSPFWRQVAAHRATALVHDQLNDKAIDW